MNKKWISIPVIFLSVLGLGGATLANNANASRRRPRTYSTQITRIQKDANYAKRQVRVYNHGLVIRVRGKVTPLQLFHFIETNYSKYGCYLINGNGRVMDMTGNKKKGNYPVWHYDTLQSHLKGVNSTDPSTGRAQNSWNNIWLAPSKKHPVHMHTPMKRGYYYMSKTRDSSVLAFKYNGKTLNYTRYSFGFILPAHLTKGYHGLEKQLIANLRRQKIVAPQGYTIVNKGRKTYTVHFANLHHDHRFPTPVVNVTKDNIPVEYNESGRLVSAGANIPSSSTHNLDSALRSAKLQSPGHGLQPSIKDASLSIGKDGNEYVNVPTFNKPKAPNTIVKKVVKVVHPQAPTPKLHWIKANHECQLYTGMTQNGTMKNPVKKIRPGYNDTFHLTKIITLHARNGNTFGRYQISYQGKTYYATTIPYYTGNAYYQPSEVEGCHAIKTILPIREYRSHVYDNKTEIRRIPKGVVLHIKKIIPIGRDLQYRFILNNGNYVTANKNFVQLD